jgi:hypothetical protein
MVCRSPISTGSILDSLVGTAASLLRVLVQVAPLRQVQALVLLVPCLVEQLLEELARVAFQVKDRLGPMVRQPKRRLNGALTLTPFTRSLTGEVSHDYCAMFISD